MNDYYTHLFGDGDLHGDAKGGNRTYSVARLVRGAGYDPEDDSIADIPDHITTLRCVRYAVELTRLRI